MPEACTQKLASTFDADGLALVVSLWKDNATKMAWLNGACDAPGGAAPAPGGGYPECDLATASFEVVHVEMESGGHAPFEATEYATCRLNIPWQCCYDSGLGACTTPSDGSQYCYESARNCLVDCHGGEFCQCDDAKGGQGCDKSWFVPGAKGTDRKAGVECVSSPPTQAQQALEEQPGALGQWCYSGRATYPTVDSDLCVWSGGGVRK